VYGQGSARIRTCVGSRFLRGYLSCSNGCNGVRSQIQISHTQALSEVSPTTSPSNCYTTHVSKIKLTCPSHYSSLFPSTSPPCLFTATIISITSFNQSILPHFHKFPIQETIDDTSLVPAGSCHFCHHHHHLANSKKFWSTLPSNCFSFPSAPSSLSLGLSTFRFQVRESLCINSNGAYDSYPNSDHPSKCADTNYTRRSVIFITSDRFFMSKPTLLCS
jgi:hypothetical protein